MTTECRQRAALGETCQLGFINSCEAGSACVGIDFESGVFEGTCEALPGQGEPCFPDDMIRCAPGFECGEGDVCGKQKALGEPCEDGSDCFSEYCAANATARWSVAHTQCAKSVRHGNTTERVACLSTTRHRHRMARCTWLAVDSAA